MTSAESSPRTVRLLTAILLVATFAAGSVAGAGLCRWVSPKPPPPPMFPPIPLEELGLSAEQQRNAHDIVERHRPELEAILRETYPKVRAVNQQTQRELREVLTSEQRARLDEFEARRPPPRPGPPGQPPPPPDSHGPPRPPLPPPFGFPPGPPPDTSSAPERPSP